MAAHGKIETNHVGCQM